jgi:predicted AAA+ superfamily ATPase
MKRDLLKWKHQKHPLSLLLRGARQVGKTHTVTKFVKKHFKHCIVLNFERNSKHKEFFNPLDPWKIKRKAVVQKWIFE